MLRRGLILNANSSIEKGVKKLAPAPACTTACKTWAACLFRHRRKQLENRRPPTPQPGFLPVHSLSVSWMNNRDEASCFALSRALEAPWTTSLVDFNYRTIYSNGFEPVESRSIAQVLKLLSRKLEELLLTGRENELPWVLAAF